MLMDSDFEEIKIHLKRACDQCLLTKRHCEACNVDRLLGIIESIEQNCYKPTYLISLEDLAALTRPGSPDHPVVVEKWKNIIHQNLPGRPGGASPPVE
ncbi:MAG: hypothetical protein K6T66_02970 [Peptococcaceae bacterium]|nr:hypothetical protein [Peptococcaceae bacterium]